MHSTLIAAALVCTPLTAIGQNMSLTAQVGEYNQQTTIQTGRNTAVTRQYGSKNIASIKQNGQRNVATIAQIGEGHVRNIEQNGNNLGYGSLQATDDTYTGSHSGTGGNAFTSTTLDIEVTN